MTTQAMSTEDKREENRTQTLALPADIEQLIWEFAKADVRKRLKPYSWKDVHRELKANVCCYHHRYVVSLNEASREAFLPILEGLSNAYGHQYMDENMHDDESQPNTIDVRHTTLVASHANVSVEMAVASLTRNNGDIMNAIVELSV
jgi:NACalpha-BTF3-like transcription factor